MLGEFVDLVSATDVPSEDWRAAGAALLALGGEGSRIDVPAGPYDPRRGPLRRAWDDVLLLRFISGEMEMLAATLERVDDGFGALWRAFTQPEERAEAEQVVRAAIAEGDAARAIDATCLWALLCLELGEVEDAVAVGRRASRMAGAEGIVTREYLANLVLARVRRQSGQPAAAARILKALTEVAPKPFARWIDWELAFADAPTKAANPLANVGQVPRPLWHGFELELNLFVEAVDGGAEAKHPWIWGETEDVPRQLRGLVVPALDESGRETAAAYVFASASERSRRFLAQGIVRRGRSADEFVFNLSGRRTYIALAALALAPSSRLTVADLVQAVYGFGFIPSKHQGTFRTLLYRMREELGERGAIDRQDDVCQLLVLEDFIIPDPRCTAGLEELILRLLALRGERLKIDEIAAGLSVPRRTVQRALKGLVEVGTCEVISEGRNAFYRMEDTTFSDPTLTRLRAGRSSSS